MSAAGPLELAAGQDRAFDRGVRAVLDGVSTSCSCFGIMRPGARMCQRGVACCVLSEAEVRGAGGRERPKRGR